MAMPADAYDGDGNLRDHPAVGQMQYDAEGRLTQFTALGSAVSNYYYDASGRRVWKTSQGFTTAYVYDTSGNVIAEYGGAPASSTGTTYVTVDQLGSTRVVSDGTGHRVSCSDYFPFGEEMLTDVPSQIRSDAGCYGAVTGFPDKFTGKERDGESGLDYFGARYFAGAQGRFTSLDPAFESENVENPQSWDRYAYVYNRSLTLTDPDGRCPQCLPALGAGLVGGTISAGTAAFYDWYTTGSISGSDVGAAFAGGFVSAGLPVLTLGTSLVAEAGFGTIAAVGAASNVAGGVLTRSLDSSGANTSAIDPTAVLTDAVTGGGGALIGNGVGLLVKRDFAPLHPPIGTFGTRAFSVANRAYRSAATRLDQGARAVSIGIGTAISGAFSNLLNAFSFEVPPPPPPAPPNPPKFGADSIFKPCAEGDPNCGQ
jgi:RHS repeat-associated protein